MRVVVLAGFVAAATPLVLLLSLPTMQTPAPETPVMALVAESKPQVGRGRGERRRRNGVGVIIINKNVLIIIFIIIIIIIITTTTTLTTCRPSPPPATHVPALTPPPPFTQALDVVGAGLLSPWPLGEYLSRVGAIRRGLGLPGGRYVATRRPLDR
jgi:hypothetical protein